MEQRLREKMEMLLRIWRRIADKRSFLCRECSACTYYDESSCSEIMGSQ